MGLASILTRSSPVSSGGRRWRATRSRGQRQSHVPENQEGRLRVQGAPLTHHFWCWSARAGSGAHRPGEQQLGRSSESLSLSTTRLVVSWFGGATASFVGIMHAILFPSCPPLVDRITFDWQYPLVTRLLDCGLSSAYSDRNAETALIAATRARQDVVCRVRLHCPPSAARNASFGP